jgi:polyphosphate kinase
MAIKMTLYRTNEGSTFVKSLITAAERGKQVACLVELQARFDEERNLNWGNQLEDAGVHVVYGIPGYKIHTKTALVVRKESDGSLKSYAHIGTGNYNSITSNVYTDIGIFTSDKKICNDLVQLFHFLTGKSLFNSFQKLLVAPFNMKKTFLDLIQREIDHAKNGKDALIIVKVNSFDEIEIAEKLYEASCAGVKIKMYVRGFCTLRPKVKGLSENIEVFSIIGRFLEHSRIFYFKNGHEKVEKGDWYIGSADWMYRNLQNRVEVITPVEEKTLKIRLNDILEIMSKDNSLKWEMDSEGNYSKPKSSSHKSVNTHESLMGIELRNMH